MNVKKFSENFENIFFHDIIVKEPEKYDFLASHGGSWAGEAYFLYVHMNIFLHQLIEGPRKWYEQWHEYAKYVYYIEKQ